MVPEESILKDALDLCLTIKHPLQDCLYVATARQLGVTFVTADRPLHDRAKPIYGEISLLAGCLPH
jgi:predicted nucleic acid-binding protein